MTRIVTSPSIRSASKVLQRNGLAFPVFFDNDGPELAHVWSPLADVVARLLPAPDHVSRSGGSFNRDPSSQDLFGPETSANLMPRRKPLQRKRPELKINSCSFLRKGRDVFLVTLVIGPLVDAL